MRHLRRLCKDFSNPSPSLFSAEVHRKSRCVKQPGKVGKAAEAAHMAHPIGWSVYSVAAQSLATVLEETQLAYMESGKRNGVTEWGWDKAFTVSVQASANAVGPSDPSYKNRNKRRECASANRRSVWLVQLDGLDVFVLRTKVTEDDFVKWAFVCQVGKAILRTSFTVGVYTFRSWHKLVFFASKTTYKTVLTSGHELCFCSASVKCKHF